MKLLAAALCLIAASVQPVLAQRAQGWRFERVENPDLPGRFIEGRTDRADGSTLSFYLAPACDANGPRPLLIYLMGSGAQSHFVRMEHGGEMRVAVTTLGLVASAAGDRFHVAGYEKRGVEFCGVADRPGSGMGAPPEYTKHATLEHHVADAKRLLDTLIAEDAVDPSRVIVVGHSEGADVAAGLAAVDPRVTDVVFLSGGGAAQFFDLLVLRRRAMIERGATPEEVAAELGAMEASMRAIFANPDDEERFFAGHAYKRWASFASQSAAENLKRTDARIFAAHGSADRSTPIESFDLLAAELLTVRREGVELRRYPGLDHSFSEPGAAPGPSGMRRVIEEALAWLDQEAAREDR